MNDCKLPAIPKRLQRLKRWMQGKATIQIDAAVFFTRWQHGNRWPHVVIRFLKEWCHYIQTVGCAALKDGDQNLTPAAGLSSQRRRLQQPGRRKADSGDSDARG